MCSWPDNVGILAIEIVFPSQYVDQNELETYDRVSPGKYTIGLGQEKMGFCNDREDINSLCLTAFHRLLDRHHISPMDIGRLEVGTETIIDKSKSVKTVLMQLLEPYGVTDVEGADVTNACYGGTAAFFNAVNWVESSAWDGRLAVVVAGDIAVYAKGAARPTGGAGAAAILVGPNAPLVLDRGQRVTHVRHVYDFYKPDLTSMYPVVDGRLSIQCYLSALDNCYGLYKKKSAKTIKNRIDLHHFDAFLFHSPFCKLVQKSLARLAFNDFLSDPAKYPKLQGFSKAKLEETYFDRDIEKAFLAHSKDDFDAKTKPSLLLSSQIGNMYTASIWSGLVSFLLNKKPAEIIGNKIGMFSYGSGMAASLFSFTVTQNVDAIEKVMRGVEHTKHDLEAREKVSPQQFESTLENCERHYHSAPFTPTGSIEHFFPGTYYLKSVDEVHRRMYERIPMTSNGYI